MLLVHCPGSAVHAGAAELPCTSPEGRKLGVVTPIWAQDGHGVWTVKHISARTCFQQRFVSAAVPGDGRHTHVTTFILGNRPGPRQLCKALESSFGPFCAVTL